MRAYAAGHPGYPCDSTLQQLYDGAEFEAYHELGARAVIAAASAPAAEDPLPLLNAASLAGHAITTAGRPTGRGSSGRRSSGWQSGGPVSVERAPVDEAARVLGVG